MTQNSAVLALDIGEKRIGVAIADGAVRIARCLPTIDVDGSELERLYRYATEENVELVVIGYPRNQSGEPTAQTQFVEAFAERFREVVDVPFVFQDESLTSVMAEQQLKAIGKPYEKGDIDALAAAIILEDYLETNR